MRLFEYVSSGLGARWFLMIAIVPHHWCRCVCAAGLAGISLSLTQWGLTIDFCLESTSIITINYFLEIVENERCFEKYSYRYRLEVTPGRKLKKWIEKTLSRESNKFENQSKILAVYFYNTFHFKYFFVA